MDEIKVDGKTLAVAGLVAVGAVGLYMMVQGTIGLLRMTRTGVCIVKMETPNIDKFNKFMDEKLKKEGC